MFTNFNPSTDIAVGIDLGTTNSAIAVWSDELKRAKVIKVDDMEKTIPSVVAFEKTRTAWIPIIGRKAQRHGIDSPNAMVHNIKRFMGQESVNSKSIQALMNNGGVSFNVLPASEKTKGMVEDDTKYPSKVLVEIFQDKDKKKFFPEEISSLILSHLKTKCELYFNDKKIAKFAVISVPAHFNHSQRLATLEAAFQAGFVDVKIISEPTAAALAYGLGITGRKHVFVFDLGGGTFDTSILKIDNGNIDVLCTAGDNNLGGNDIDDLILLYCLKELLMMSNLNRKDNNNDDVKELCKLLGFSHRSITFTRIKDACKMTKKSLSRNDKSFIILGNEIRNGIPCEIKDGVNVQKEEKPIRIPLSRKKFNKMIEPILKRCINIVQNALDDANLKPKEIDEIVMVGGCTRTPIICKKMEEIFTGKTLCTSINPDQVVAEGAAIRAAMYAGVDYDMLKDVLMMDVLPTSIGLEDANGKFIPLLQRLSKIPCKVTKSFRTFEDNQPGVTVRIYEGEDEVANKNHKMGEFNFFIPSSKRGKGGEVAVDVTFHLTEGGIIQVKSNYDDDKSATASQSENIRFLFLLLLLLGLMSMFVYLRLNPLKEDVFINNDL